MKGRKASGLSTALLLLAMVSCSVNPDANKAESTENTDSSKSTASTERAASSESAVGMERAASTERAKDDESATQEPVAERESPPTPMATDFATWMRQHLNTREWPVHQQERKLTSEILQGAFRLGRQFLIENQKREGNFHYRYDFVKKEMDLSDSQVRQAGALWGLSLTYQFEQEPRNKVALERALRFFFGHTQAGPAEGTSLIAYPGDHRCDTGTVALVALSIVEYLRTEKAGKVSLGDAYRRHLTQKLNGYVGHLKFMRLENKHFSRSYSLSKRTRHKRYSPYYDGETMLCLIKAAKYLGYTDLIPLIEDSARALAEHYTLDQWEKDPDSDLTKGFFQWSCMAFWEYQDAGWRDADLFGDYVLSLAWWMIHTHKTLERQRNTAYAYEGIIHAYRLAQSRGHQAALNDLEYTIDTALYKLISWQVGGPLASKNKFLVAHPTNDPLAIGGVMNHKSEAPLRIDVAQHQTHAVQLALQYVYGENSPR